MSAVCRRRRFNRVVGSQLSMYSKKNSEDIPCAQAATISAPTPGLWACLDNTLWLDGIRCISSLEYGDVIAEPEYCELNKGNMGVHHTSRSMADSMISSKAQPFTLYSLGSICCGCRCSSALSAQLKLPSTS